MTMIDSITVTRFLWRRNADTAMSCMISRDLFSVCYYCLFLLKLFGEQFAFVNKHSYVHDEKVMF